MKHIIILSNRRRRRPAHLPDLGAGATGSVVIIDDDASLLKSVSVSSILDTSVPAKHFTARKRLPADRSLHSTLTTARMKATGAGAIARDRLGTPVVIRRIWALYPPETSLFRVATSQSQKAHVMYVNLPPLGQCTCKSYPPAQCAFSFFVANTVI